MNYRYEVDTHTHTTMSGHAFNTIAEMAARAKEIGLKAIAITDHAPLIPYAPGEIYFGNYHVIDRDWYGVRLLMGIELDILNDGTVDLSEKNLKKQDIALASIHSQVYKNAGVEGNTQAMISAASNPAVDILSHPDDSKFPVDYDRITACCAKTGVILEMNENSYRSDLRLNCEENALTYLQLCKERGVMIAIGSDAHFVNRVGVHDRAEAVMHKVNFPEELVANSCAEKFIEYLQSRKDRLNGKVA